jgi:chromosome partitioning protein
MSAKIIAVANQKGGCGKSTVAMHLAGALALEGLRVQVADADKQNTATKWSAHAPDNKPFPAIVVNIAAAGAKVHREIQKAFDLFDVIIVDCPPNMESVVPASVLLVSDLVIMAMQPTMTDLDSLADFLPLVERSQASNPGLQSRVLVNRMKRSAMSALTLEALADRGIVRMNVTIGDRAVYPEGDLMGTHILAQKGVPAAARVEIKALRDEVMAILALGDDNDE